MEGTSTLVGGTPPAAGPSHTRFPCSDCCQPGPKGGTGPRLPEPVTPPDALPTLQPRPLQAPAPSPRHRHVGLALLRGCQRLRKARCGPAVRLDGPHKAFPSQKGPRWVSWGAPGITTHLSPPPPLGPLLQEAFPDLPGPGGTVGHTVTSDGMRGLGQWVPGGQRTHISHQRWTLRTRVTGPRPRKRLTQDFCATRGFWEARLWRVPGPRLRAVSVS